MRAEVILIRMPEPESNDKAESEIIEFEEMKHIPHAGDRLFWGGRDYTVTEVTWNLHDNIVTIGAEF